MLTSDQKGAIAESAIAFAAIKLHIGVLKPLSDGHRYDLVFDTGSRLLRVQCKWAVRRGDVIVVNCRSSRRGRDGFIHSVYSREEVDLVVGYCPDIERCYALPPEVFEGHSAISLRLSPTRNNQLIGVKWARDYEFERLDFLPPGAIAQLGERHAGSVEAAGSSPAGSTNCSLLKPRGPRGPRGFLARRCRGAHSRLRRRCRLPEGEGRRALEARP